MTLLHDALVHIPASFIALTLGFSRTSGYYHPITTDCLLTLKAQVLKVWETHPSYGHRRLSLSLGIGKKRVRHCLQAFGLKPYKRQGRWRKRRDERRVPAPFPNHLKGTCSCAPNHTWVSDFTYLPFKKKFIYLATVMDTFTREVVGWHVSNRHTKDLVMEAFLDALANQGLRRPTFIHSDQGCEYTAKEYLELVQALGIRISMSSKASPWENGYQESFFNNFKTDLGLEFDRFDDTGYLLEAIHHTIHDYNHDRIQTTLKMSPHQFRLQFENRRNFVEKRDT